MSLVPIGIVASRNQANQTPTYKYPIMQVRASGLGTSGQRIALQGRGTFNNTTSAAQYVLHPALVSQLYFTTGTAPGTGNAWTFAIRNNDVATSVATTISDAATSGSDATNATNIYAGQTLTLGQVNTGSPGTGTSPTRVSVMTRSTYQNICSTTGTTVSATTRLPIQGSGNSTTVSTVQQVMPIAGTFKSMGVALGGTAISGGSFTVALYINGVTTSLTRSQTSNTWAVVSGDVSVSAGDLVHIEATVVGTPSAVSVMTTLGFQASTPSHGVSLVGGGSSPATSTFNAFYGNTNWNATESGMQMYGLICRFKRIYVSLATAPGGVTSRTVVLRVNGSDTALSVTITGTNTTGFTDDDVDIASLGDLVSLSHTTSGSPASSVVRVGVSHEVL